MLFFEDILHYICFRSVGASNVTMRCFKESYRIGSRQSYKPPMKIRDVSSNLCIIKDVSETAHNNKPVKGGPKDEYG